MDDSAASASSWSDVISLILTVHYGYSLAIEPTLVVPSLLRCIVRLNESLIKVHYFAHHYKWLSPYNRVLFKGIGGEFGHSLCLSCVSCFGFMLP